MVSIEYVKLLAEDTLKTAEEYHKEMQKANGNYYSTTNYGSREHGKQALSRKITILRQTLLELEKELVRNC